MVLRGVFVFPFLSRHMRRSPPCCFSVCTMHNKFIHFLRIHIWTPLFPFLLLIVIGRSLHTRTSNISFTHICSHLVFFSAALQRQFRFAPRMHMHFLLFHLFFVSSSRSPILHTMEVYLFTSSCSVVGVAPSSQPVGVGRTLS